MKVRMKPDVKRPKHTDETALLSLICAQSRCAHIKPHKRTLTTKPTDNCGNKGTPISSAVTICLHQHTLWAYIHSTYTHSDRQTHADAHGDSTYTRRRTLRRPNTRAYLGVNPARSTVLDEGHDWGAAHGAGSHHQQLVLLDSVDERLHVGSHRLVRDREREKEVDMMKQQASIRLKMKTRLPTKSVDVSFWNVPLLCIDHFLFETRLQNHFTTKKHWTRFLTANNGYRYLVSKMSITPM